MLSRKLLNPIVVDSVNMERDFYNTCAKEYADSWQYKSTYRCDASDVGRPDRIAYTAYQSVEFWWVIMIANNINDPFNDIRGGLELKIPSDASIENFVSYCQNKIAKGTKELKVVGGGNGWMVV